MSVRDAIFAARVGEEVIEGPCGKVLVKGLTVADKDSIQHGWMSGKPWRPGILLHCCYDPETDEPVFRKDDAIESLPIHVVEPYVEAAIRLSAFTDEEIEELEGNSERTPSSSIASS